MTPDFRLVPQAAQGETDELAVRRPGDGLGHGGFSHPRRSHQAEYGPLVFLQQALHRQVFQDSLLHLLQTVVVFFQDPFRVLEAVRVFRPFEPGQVEDPVDVVSHHRGLGGHGGHHFQFFDLVFDLFMGFFGQFLLFKALFQFLYFRLETVLLAHLLLDGPHLLVQVVILLGLLHLFLDPALDPLLHLEDFHLGNEKAVYLFEPLAHPDGLQNALLVLQLDIEV